MRSFSLKDGVKAVTKYQASDGSLFSSIKKAYKHTQYYNAVQEAAKLLGEVYTYSDPGCSYTNGDGYFQLTDEQLKNFLAAYRNVIKKFESDLVEKFDQNPKGWIGRYLDDGGGMAYQLWGLASRIDSQNRIWGQIYYANNPTEGKQIELNRKRKS